MNYTVNTDAENVSTTYEGSIHKWSIEDLYKSEFNVDSLMEVLMIIDTFKKKYPNDETITDFEGIVRDEICQIFGGTTITE